MSRKDSRLRTDGAVVAPPSVEITNKNRGLADRGLPVKLPPISRDLLLGSEPRDTPELRAASVRGAAVDLGRIYQALRPEDRSLGDWAVPGQRTVMGEPILPFQIDLATERVYGEPV